MTVGAAHILFQSVVDL